MACLCSEYGIDILYAFGSRAKEVKDWVDEEIEHLPTSLSDIDIGIKLLAGKHLHVKEKVQFTVSLEEFFKVPRVDFIVIPEADPFLAANIVRGGKIIL